MYKARTDNHEAVVASAVGAEVSVGAIVAVGAVVEVLVASDVDVIVGV